MFLIKNIFFSVEHDTKNWIINSYNLKFFNSGTLHMCNDFTLSVYPVFLDIWYIMLIAHVRIYNILVHNIIILYRSYSYY